MLEGRRYGLSYDEVWDNNPDAIRAVEDWTALVEETSRKPMLERQEAARAKTKRVEAAA